MSCVRNTQSPPPLALNCCTLRFSEECLSTLQFANRCRSVHNNPRVNKLGDGPAGDQRKLKKLQDEIQALRQGRRRSPLEGKGRGVRGEGRGGGRETEVGVGKTLFLARSRTPAPSRLRSPLAWRAKNPLMFRPGIAGLGQPCRQHPSKTHPTPAM